MKTPRLQDILIVALVALATWNIRGCVTPVPANESLIRAEMRIEALEEKRRSDSVALAGVRGQYDSLIAAYLEKDDEAKIRYITVKNAYDKAPSFVHSLDRENLRRELTNFRP